MVSNLVVHILNYIADAFNNNEIVVGVFLDFSKAFDLVDHKIILTKLEKIGIKNVNLKWFENILKIEGNMLWSMMFYPVFLLP